MEDPNDTFTCLKCKVVYPNLDLMKDHYKTDWHIYNLKRLVVNLPSVTAEAFQEKVLKQRQIEQLKQEDKSAFCDICRKSFGHPNSYAAHLVSKKHKDNEKKQDKSPIKQDANDKKEMAEDKVPIKDELNDKKEVNEEEEESDGWDEEEYYNPIENNDCLFCLHHSRHFEKNLDHMTSCHSFYVPDVEYCTSVKELLLYLAERIECDFACLWCDDEGRRFRSAEAARQHMLDKGHCRMLFEGAALAKYIDFYDYSSSYPDAADNDNDPDEEVAVPDLDGTEFQLVLPSGAIVGHRTLMRYYRQKINPNSAVVVKNNSSRKVMSTYRALGLGETNKDATATKARDMQFMKRIRAKWNLKLGVKGNKLQTHFRAQTRMC